MERALSERTTCNLYCECLWISVMVKGQVTVQRESEVSEYVDLFYFLAIGGDVIQKGGECVENQFFYFPPH